jgi:predicted O-methyltransferase YrrM
VVVSLAKAVADRMAYAFGLATSPALRFIGRHRAVLPRFHALADRSGFQLRSDHYYEPTYAEAHLPAYTAGERNLPAVDLNEAGQLALLASFTFVDELKALPARSAGPGEFGYDNDWYGAGDVELYYSMIRARKPRRIVEIGSGNSTLVALLAIGANRRDDPDYTCGITCIEPYEMPWLEAKGVEVVRERVELIALDRFAALGPGDILFVDSSHVIRPHGDVLREFFEILPSLADGVIVHVHDVFTPRDYPEHWLRAERRLWNEQYLLEAFLAYNDRFQVICAANWLKHNHWDAFSRACPIVVPSNEPGAFWIEKKAKN